MHLTLKVNFVTKGGRYNKDDVDDFVKAPPPHGVGDCVGDGRRRVGGEIPRALQVIMSRRSRINCPLNSLSSRSERSYRTSDCGSQGPFGFVQFPFCLVESNLQHTSREPVGPYS